MLLALGPGRSRWLTAVALIVLSAGVLAVSGCGGGDEAPAVCQDLEQLSSDIDGLHIEFQAGEAAIADIADIEASLDAIGTDLSSVKASAEAELSAPIADLESSLDAFSADVEAAKAEGDLTEDSVQSLVDSGVAVSTSWEALKSAAPDCDL